MFIPRIVHGTVPITSMHLLPPSRDARGILGNRLLKLVRPPAVRCVDSVLVCVLLCVYLSYVLSLLYSTVLLHWTEVFSTAY